MALVVITLHDTEDGSLDVSAVSEPYIPDPGNEAEATQAQAAATVMVSALAGVLGLDEAGEETPEAPKLHVIGDTGADE